MLRIQLLEDGPVVEVPAEIERAAIEKNDDSIVNAHVLAKLEAKHGKPFVAELLERKGAREKVIASERQAKQEEEANAKGKTTAAERGTAGGQGS